MLELFLFYKKFQQNSNDYNKNFKIQMRKSKPKSIIKPKKTNQTNQYAQFLQNKLKQQNYLSHLVNLEIKQSDQKLVQQLNKIQELRKSDNKKRQKITKLEEQIEQYKQQINKLRKENQKMSYRIQSLSAPQVLKQCKQPLQTKLVFKQFLTTSFPTYHPTIKRILRFFMIIQQHHQKSPQQRIKVYHEFVKSLVQKIMNFIFPKKTQQQNNLKIAQNMVMTWRNQEANVETTLRKQVYQLKNKEILYIKNIQEKQTEILRLRASKNVLQAKIINYQKAMKTKASQFIVHLKKALVNKSQYGQDDEAIQKMSQIIQIFQSMIKRSEIIGIQLQQAKQSNNIINNSLPFISLPIQDDLQNTVKSKLRKQQAPLLKKNIYGYYQHPQLSHPYNTLSLTKHQNLNKQTQTLPDDLTILIAHPVILIYLIDGNIKPLRIRHNIDFYVRIHKNREEWIDSDSVLGLQPVWKRQYLVKNYDFPFINVELMNKSKGLRDKSLGDGKLLLARCQQKIVNIRKQKQFQGRVRFGISYPKGNIFQYVINSIQLIIPQTIKILNQVIEIESPMNPSIIQKFSPGSLIKYLTNKSIIIIQGSQGVLTGCVVQRKIQGSVALEQFTQREGEKIIQILAGEWRIVLSGYVVLLVSQETQPEKIQTVQEDKYFAVRAGHPLISAIYNKITLYSHVKLPLVFRYDSQTCLTCISQSKNSKNSTQQQILDPILTGSNTVRLHPLLSTPSFMYQFFLTSLEGAQVTLSYQSNLYIKLPQQIKLFISLNKTQQQFKDPLLRKGKRSLIQKQEQKLQFFVEVKDLMQGYYKVFNKTYKTTGYAKFKLGYVKINNLLTTQGQTQLFEDKKKKLLLKKNVTIDQPIQGQYYVQMQINKAYFPTMSSTSKYSVQLKSQKYGQIFMTQQKQGHRVQWHEKVLFKLQFSSKSPTKVTLNLFERTLFSCNIIYTIDIIITKNLLKLGSLILQLPLSLPYPQQNIVILSNIHIPSIVYSMLVSDIQIQVQQEADWIGKIDPYIKFFNNQKQVYKTTTKDGAGDNAIWQNVNWKYVVEQKMSYQQHILSQHNDNRYLLFQCRIYDQDIINDDYLGKAFIQYDHDIAHNQEIDCIRANIVKDEKNCGSIKIHGKFKQINQSTHQLYSQNYVPLDSKKDRVFQICLTQLQFFNQDLLSSDQQIWIIYSDKENHKQIKERILLNKESLLNVNFSFYKILKQNVQCLENISLEIRQQKKSFFKVQQIHLGSITLTVAQIKCLQKIMTISVKILEISKKQIGKALLFIEPIYQTCYSVIDAYTSGSSLIMNSLTTNDCLQIKATTKQYIYPLKENFNDMYLIANQDQFGFGHLINQSIKENTLQLSRNNAIDLITRLDITYVDKKNGINDCFTVLNLHKNIKYSRQTAFADINNKLDKTVKKIYKLKILHWQPCRHKSLAAISISIILSSLSHSIPSISFKYTLNQAFNSYYVFDSEQAQQNLTKMILFSQDKLPKMLQIFQDDSHNKIDIQLNSESRYLFVKDKGVIYYQLQEYKQNYRRLYFSNIYFKLSNKTTQTIHNIKITLNQSQLVYQNPKIIGRNGFLFQNVQFFVPTQKTNNKFILKIQKLINNKIGTTQIQITGKNNKWDYIYQNKKEYLMHCTLLIESDMSVGNGSKKKEVPQKVCFIQMQSIRLSPSSKLSSQQLILRVCLFNQIIQVKAKKSSQQSTPIYQLNTPQLLYIYQQRQIILHIQIIQQGIFSTKTLGQCLMKLQSHDLLITQNNLTGQIKNKQLVLGKVEFTYKVKPQINYLYVDVDKVIIKHQYDTLIVQMVPVGINKNKRQRAELNLIKNSNNHKYDTKNDLIVAENDYQDYNIHLINRQNLQLLGKFKICDLIKKDDDNKQQYISAIYPLRVIKNELNGLISINFIEQTCKKQVIYKQFKQKINYLKLRLTKLHLHNQASLPNLSFTLQTAFRLLQTLQSSKPINPSQSIQLILQQTQKLIITIKQQNKLIADTTIQMSKLKDKQEDFVVFRRFQDGKVYGIMVGEISKVNCHQGFYYIIEHIAVTQLKDMELFVKMNPYAIISSNHRTSNQILPNDIQSNLSLNLKQPQSSKQHNNLNKFVTQIAQGKQNIFWKVGLIVQNDTKITLMDKDIKFDDYIGQMILSSKYLQTEFNKEQQSTPSIKRTFDLISNQDNQKTANIQIKVKKVVINSNKQQIFTPQFMENQYLFVIHFDQFNVKDLQTQLQSNQLFSLRISISESIQQQIVNILQIDGLSLRNAQKTFLSNGLVIQNSIINIEKYLNLSKLKLFITMQIISITKTIKQIQILEFKNKRLQLSQENWVPHQIKIFKTFQLIPLLNQIFNMSKQIFLLKKLSIWFDYMMFYQVLIVSIIIKNQNHTKYRNYSLQIDLSNLDYKNGIHLVDLEILKYLKYQIWVQNDQIIQIYMHSKYQNKQMIDTSRIDLSKSPQILLKSKYIQQSLLTRPSVKDLSMGTSYFLLQKINLPFVKSQYQSVLNKITKKTTPLQSSSLWIQLNITKAILKKDIQWISKMDPYCQVIYQDLLYGKVNRRTKTKDNAGVLPVWDQRFFIPISSFGKQYQQIKQTIQVNIIDEQTTFNRIIAQGTLEFSLIEQSFQKPIQKAVNLVSPNNQPQGTAFFSLSLSSRHIIFTRIVNIIKKKDNQQALIKSYQQNKQNYKQQYAIIQIGRSYPISIQIPLCIKLEDQTLTWEWNDLVKYYQKSQMFYFDQLKVIMQFLLFQT